MQPVEIAIVGNENLCKCVGKHVPLPTVLHSHHIVPVYLGGGDESSNRVYLCPTTHDNVHSLLRQYAKYKGRPPGSVRKHYSEYVEHLAERAWAGATSRAAIHEVISTILQSALDTPPAV